MLDKGTEVRFIRSIGEKRSKSFEKLGVFTAGDLISLYPRRYEDKSIIKKAADVEDGEVCTLILHIDTKPESRMSRNGLNYITFIASDDTGSVSMTFFNQSWLAKSLVQGSLYRFYGKVTYSMFARTMQSPDIDAVIEGRPLQGIYPIYPLTAGMTQNAIHTAVKQCLPLIETSEETLPQSVLTEHSLIGKSQALKQLHFPESMEQVERARKRLAFEELLIFQLGVLCMRQKTKKENAILMALKGTNSGGFINSLPFRLTGAQQRVIKDIYDDMQKPHPMVRLVQGDVGSGKTAVSAAAIFLAVKNGCQAAMMAPTEILAKQHAETFKKLFSSFGIRVDLLTGAMNATARKDVKKRLEAGEIDLIVATHALIQPDTVFSQLGLIVTDEQHRFGVAQRAMLAEKSGAATPHTLVMSATPIPRTLSLILYGDLDLSVIDELPPGRQTIDTFSVGDGYRKRVYNFINERVLEGRQAYVICPLVEDSEDPDAPKLKSAEQHGAELAKQLPSLKVAVLHGKQSAKTKDEIMNSFSRGEVDVLVSTTVVEVGVDVPNATVMVIENAERFGLSQLHQLRGRVGRGTHKSYCILIHEGDSERSKQRLNIMCATNDGFKIAQTDLEMRGPGEFMGEKQHGEVRFKLADIADMDTVNKTRAVAEKICAEGLFGNEKYTALADETIRMFRIGGSENIFH